jgi:Arm DNA-binding domain
MLTDSIIRKTQPKDSDSKLFDGAGLFLLIRATGHRGWRFKYRIHGHEKLISLGPYPTVSLAKARLKLRRARALLLDGIDPSLKRKAEKYAGADSFEAAAREWYGSHECRWADSYSDHIIRRFERDIFPWIGNTLHPSPHFLGMYVQKCGGLAEVECLHRFSVWPGCSGVVPSPGIGELEA